MHAVITSGLGLESYIYCTTLPATLSCMQSELHFLLQRLLGQTQVPLRRVARVGNVESSYPLAAVDGSSTEVGACDMMGVSRMALA